MRNRALNGCYGYGTYLVYAILLNKLVYFDSDECVHCIGDWFYFNNHLEFYELKDPVIHPVQASVPARRACQRIKGMTVFGASPSIFCDC